MHQYYQDLVCYLSIDIIICPSIIFFPDIFSMITLIHKQIIAVAGYYACSAFIYLFFWKKKKNNLSLSYGIRATLRSYEVSNRYMLEGMKTTILVYVICKCDKIRLPFNQCSLIWTFSIGLDKNGYQVDSFLNSRQKHRLWVLIRSALLRRF